MCKILLVRKNVIMWTYFRGQWVSTLQRSD